MDETNIFACSEFWKDVRRLRKHLRADFLDCPFSDEDFEKLSCAEKFDCLNILRQISTAIKNNITNLDLIPNNNKNAKHQPFLPIEFIVWKLRWGVDKHGPPYGLRIMYCVKGKHIVFANIKHKKEVKDDEKAFQAETMERLGLFFKYEYVQ